MPSHPEQSDGDYEDVFAWAHDVLMNTDDGRHWDAAEAMLKEARKLQAEREKLIAALARHMGDDMKELGLLP